MSAASTRQAVEQGGAWPAYRALVGAALIAGLVVAGVYEGTRPVIAEKRARALEAAVTRLVPGTVTVQGFARAEDGRFVTALPAEARVWAGYDDAGELTGFAIVGEIMGYQDRIRGLVGVDAGSRRLTGLVVLENRETPGLGSRIASDGAFLAQFAGLELPVADLASQVQAISGATVSSRAVVRLVSATATAWLAPIREHLEDFRHG
jgi:electron transport complex protein RnfG